MNFLGQAIRAQVEAEHQALETACEAAIQGGTCGVLVLRGDLGRLVSAKPDTSVPYGHLHERRAPVSWNAEERTDR